MTMDTFEDKEDTKDYYELLGVRRHASFDEVKKAYRALALKYHPDRASPEFMGQFVNVTAAYETLTDPVRRNDYNKAMGYEHADIDSEIPEIEPEQPPEPSHSKEGARGVKIDSKVVDSEDRWDALRGKLGEHDLKVSHKAALAEPQPETEDDEDVTPWGEETTGESAKSKKFSVGGLVGNLLGKRRSEVTKKRTELKQQFRKDIEDRLHPKEPLVKSPPKKPSRPKTLAPSPQTSGFESRGSRVFNFYLSSLERYFGVERELALPGSAPGEIRRMKVHVPAGTLPGTVMEVSRGWERFDVRIDIRPDLYYAMNEGDLLVNVPVTVGEALTGVTVDVATFRGPERVSIPSMFQPGLEIRIEGKGCDTSSGEAGALVVYPFIAPPQKSSSMLDDAEKVFASQYGSSSVRSSINQPLESIAGVRAWDFCTLLPVPVTLGEAMGGCSFEVPTASGREQVTVPRAWKPEDIIVLPKAGLVFSEESGVSDLMVLPQIVLPQGISPETFAASTSIDQHYTAVRAGMPRRLKQGE